jgi:hypothetical protein
MHTARVISSQTLIAEEKKRGVLGPNVDANEEQRLIGEEEPAGGGFDPFRAADDKATADAEKLKADEAARAKGDEKVDAQAA